MDGGAWWAAVHGFTKSRIRLSDFTFTFYFHALEKEMETHSSVLAWRVPGTGEPGGLPSMGSHRVGHDWSNLAAKWRTGKPGVLQSIGWQRIKHDLSIEQQQQLKVRPAWEISWWKAPSSSFPGAYFVCITGHVYYSITHGYYYYCQISFYTLHWRPKLLNKESKRITDVIHLGLDQTLKFTEIKQNVYANKTYVYPVFVCWLVGLVLFLKTNPNWWWETWKIQEACSHLWPGQMNGSRDEQNKEK